MRKTIWKTWREASIYSVLILATSGTIQTAKADQGFNTVTMSTAAPAGTEQSFISAISSQFNAKVTANPVASNTYAIKVFGPNPDYQAPAAPPTTLEQALSLGSTVYYYGYDAGAEYEELTDRGIVLNYQLNCSTPMASVPTYDVATCEAVAGAIDAAIFQQYNSTVTVAAGN